MRSTVAVLLLLALGAEAFAPSALSSSRSALTQVNAYVPDGFTAAEWKKYQEEENKKKKTKNLGGLGPRGFKSRSFQSFQEALERGEATHLMPVFNAKEKIKAGEIRPEDVPVSLFRCGWICSSFCFSRAWILDHSGLMCFLILLHYCFQRIFQYMQRGGKWDNTDIRGARNKKKWLESDKQYAAGGYKKEQSVSIFGVGQGLDWTGTQGRTGPSANSSGEPKKKKGWFGF